MTDVGTRNHRWHALDAIRGIALLLGIFYHSALSYLPGGTWIITDQSDSKTLAALVFILHIFRMTAFFLLAGFFARLMVERRGLTAFTRDRIVRIAIPLITAWPLVILIIALTMSLHSGTDRFVDYLPEVSGLSIPLTHLWFLYFLLICYGLAGAAFVAERWLKGSFSAGRVLDRLFRFTIRSPGGILLLAIPLMAVLLVSDNWSLWFGIPAPDQSLKPNRYALVGYGFAFAIGWMLNRCSDMFNELVRLRRFHFIVAIIITGLCLNQVGLEPSTALQPSRGNKLTYVLCYSVAIWAWTWAILGYALKYLTKRNVYLRYISDSSYWVYVVHFPTILALQSALSRSALPWPVEYMLIVSICGAVALLSYHFLVENTVVGRVMNTGRFTKRGEDTPYHPPPATA